MGAFRRPGRKLARPKVEVRAAQEWIDRVTEAAAALGYRGVSDYVREAVEEKLTRDGYGTAAKPPHRPPKKGKH